MWQEARKQEKKLRGIMIDYKKRAERRRAYYTKMRMDPHQLMRIYGQKCKFHMLADGATSTNTDGQLMAWQGDPEIMIDRFDVRAHLDMIPENTVAKQEKSEEEEKFERKCSYESYRTLVQVDATGASEENFLKQLSVEETYGKNQAEKAEREKRSSKANAKIHYKYEDSTGPNKDDEYSDDDESDSDLSDIDITVDVIGLSEDQKNHLDALATQYGIGYGQYCKQLLLEKKEFEFVKRLQEEEEERAKLPGRKGKTARRTLRMKQKTLRGSPLSFAVQGSPTHDSDRHGGQDSSSDSSRSTSPFEEKVEFITEFGNEQPSPSKTSNKKPIKSSSSSRKKHESRSPHKSSRRRSSRSRSRSRGRHSRRRSRSGDRHSHHKRSRSRSRSRTRSSHHSRSNIRSRSRSRSHSRSRHSHHRKRKSYSRSPKRKHSRSRSRSVDKKKDERTKRRSRSHSPHNKNQNKSRSRSRSKEKKSRSKSPHGSIVKRLGTDKPQTVAVDKSKLTPREKMKLRMQKMLNKQIKTDKKVEQKKQEKKDMELEERDIQIYELSRMMRNRESEVKRRSPSPRGRIPSYDASHFRYKTGRSRSRSP